MTAHPKRQYYRLESSPPGAPFSSARELVEQMADSNLGRVLKKTYVLERLIGKGGMGVVYEARHARLPRRFAVKLLSRGEGSQGVKERFYREATVASKIEHDNVVDILDFDETDDGELYMVMELLQGEDLAVTLRRSGPMVAGAAFDIFAPLCEAVAAAHSAGVVHRDLKPANVFLHRKGDRRVVKVLDFGIAKIWDTTTLTSTGALLGTPCYMAPEQIEGGEVGEQVDVFALGTILYEMVTGQVAFAGTSVAQVAHRIVYGKRPRLAETVDGVGSLQPIVDRCLAVDPGERFGSVRELLAEVSGAMGVEAVGAGPAYAPTLAGDAGVERSADGSAERGADAGEGTDCDVGVAATMVATGPGEGGEASGWRAVEKSKAGSALASVAREPVDGVAESGASGGGLETTGPELDLSPQSFSTLSALRSKKKWIASGLLVVASAALGIFLVVSRFAPSGPESSVERKEAAPLRAEQVLGEEAADVLLRFADPASYHELGAEDWKRCSEAAKEVLSRGGDAKVEAVRLLARSQLLVREGRLGDAEQQAAQVVKLQPGWVAGWVSLAWIHLLRGAVEPGLQAAKRARAAGRVDHAGSFEEPGGPVEPAGWLSQGPLAAEARVVGTIAAAHIMAGEVSLAFYAAGEAEGLEQLDPAVWAARSLAAELRGDVEGAQRFGAGALMRGPEYGPAWNRAAELLFRQGKWKTGAELCRRGLQGVDVHYRPLMRRCLALARAAESGGGAGSGDGPKSRGGGGSAPAVDEHDDEHEGKGEGDDPLRKVRSAKVESLLGRYVLPLARARLFALRWRGSGRKEHANAAVEILSKIVSGGGGRLGWSRMGAEALALRCGLLSELADPRALEGCKQAAGHPEATPHTVVLAAYELIRDGKVKEGLEELRRARAVASKTGRDAREADLYAKAAGRVFGRSVGPGSEGETKKGTSQKAALFLKQTESPGAEVIVPMFLWAGPVEGGSRRDGRGGEPGADGHTGPEQRGEEADARSR